MALIHHNALRINAVVADDDQMTVLHESGWRQGPHKDTDPDDLGPIPRVLPLPEPEVEESEPVKAGKATTKKGGY